LIEVRGRHVATAVALLAAGCGRVSFERVPDAASDPAVDAGGRAFDPLVGGCLEAGTGPFQLRATEPPRVLGYGVLAASPFVLRAETDGGIDSLSFDGTQFTVRDTLTGLGWAEAIWKADGVYFIGAPGTGLWVVTLAADGTLDIVAQDTTTVVEARRVGHAGNIVFVPSGPDGLHALRWDGSQLTTVGTPLPTLGWSQGVFAIGSRVLFADANAFRVVEFDGSSFSEPIAPDTNHGGACRIWTDGTTVFVANGDGITAYSIGPTSLTELDTFTTTAPARDVWFDGQHVFVAAETAGLYALRFDGSSFSVADQVDTGGAALGVSGDGTYIYANDGMGGLHAYAGFACQRW
jgi:hypothetical protein